MGSQAGELIDRSKKGVEVSLLPQVLLLLGVTDEQSEEIRWSISIFSGPPLLEPMGQEGKRLKT